MEIQQPSLPSPFTTQKSHVCTCHPNKQLEAEKLSLGSTIDEYREQLHIEITKYNVLNASIDKLRGDLEKKIAEKDEELESLR